MNGIIDILTQINQLIASLGDNSGLLSSPEAWNGALAGYASGINEVVMKPVAYTLLTLFFMLELYNMSQRLSSLGGGQQMILQQFGLMFVKLFLCKWAVDNALFLANGILEIFQQITAAISGYVGNGFINVQLDANALAGTVDTGWLSTFMTQLILQIPLNLIHIITLLISAIVAARFIELYVLLAVAPIPLSTFCSHELHGIAVNYCKNVAAVGLQGALIYLVIGFFPALANSIFSPNTESLTSAAWGMTGLSLVLLFAVFSCGKWARSIFNAM